MAEMAREDGIWKTDSGKKVALSEDPPEWAYKDKISSCRLKLPL
jgi:hypothetical protein